VELMVSYKKTTGTEEASRKIKKENKKDNARTLTMPIKKGTRINLYIYEKKCKYDFLNESAV
jgi:hypothetical protein